MPVCGSQPRVGDERWQADAYADVAVQILSPHSFSQAVQLEESSPSLLPVTSGD